MYLAMQVRQNFDIHRSALTSELTLIEASAGTGKTYTISGLVLRLVLEKQLAIEEILVTTHTSPCSGLTCSTSRL